MLETCVDENAVRTFPAVLGFGAGLAVVEGVFDYTGGKLSGYDKDPNVDEYDRKEQLRKNWRKPIQETLQELGEGRGRVPTSDVERQYLTKPQEYMDLGTGIDGQRGSRRIMAWMYLERDPYISWITSV